MCAPEVGWGPVLEMSPLKVSTVALGWGQELELIHADLHSRSLLSCDKRPQWTPWAGGDISRSNTLPPFPSP